MRQEDRRDVESAAKINFVYSLTFVILNWFVVLQRVYKMSKKIVKNICFTIYFISLALSSFICIP